jgi:hypothetical protein
MKTNQTPENQTERSEELPAWETVIAPLAQGTEPGPDYLADLFSLDDERTD